MKTNLELSLIKLLSGCCLSALLLGGFGATASPARAQSGREAVEYSNFGQPGDTYYMLGGPTITGGQPPGGAIVANQFTASFSGQLSSIDVAVIINSLNQGSDGTFDLRLDRNDPATNLPLVSSRVTLGTLTAPSAALPTLLSLTPTPPFLLTAGTSYWLELAPHDANTAVDWNLANNGSANRTAFSDGSGNTFVAYSNQASAFRIYATPLVGEAVPEGGGTSALLLGLGLAGICAAQRALAAGAKGSRAQPQQVIA